MVGNRQAVALSGNPVAAYLTVRISPPPDAAFRTPLLFETGVVAFSETEADNST